MLSSERLLGRVTRTPLTAILGFSETLGSRYEVLDDDRRREGLEVIGRQARRLERLVGDLLWAARIDADMVTASPEAVVVGDAVQRVLDTLGGSLRGPVTLEGGALEVWADPHHLEQILANLLANASTYGAPTFAIRAWRSGDRGHVEVSDAGAGVPTEFVAELFRAFSQASVGDRRTSTGLGLGLAIVHSLVEANAGTIAYERRDGRTCFTCVLPVEEPVTEPAAG